jgi:hypothetical protein
MNWQQEAQQEDWDYALALEIYEAERIIQSNARRPAEEARTSLLPPSTPPFSYSSFSTEGWGVVKRKKEKKKAVAKVESNEFVAPAVEIIAFLKSYKTRLCEIKQHHDHAECSDYHGSDRRRDPFETPYELHECKTKLEEMFHPIVYRTKECKQGNKCPNMWPKFCAFAHSKVELRSQKDEAEKYQSSICNTVAQPPPRTLVKFCGPSSSFIMPTERQQQSIFDWGVPASIVTRECEQIEVPLSPWQKRVYAISKSLQKKIDAKIFPCRLSHSDAKDEFGCPRNVMVIGKNPAVYEAFSACLDILENPREVKQETRHYAPEVILKIQDNLEHFSKLPAVSMEVDLNASTVTVKEICANSKVSSTKLIATVFDRINVWQDVEAGQFKKTSECCCCGDMCVGAEGVACNDGHFVCVKTCFGRMVESQLPSLPSQNGNLKCAVCPNVLAMRDIAKVAPVDLYEKLQSGITDYRVGRQTEQMEQEMHQRFKEKIAEIEEKYKSGGNLTLKTKADDHAKHVRNNILNLACPHCKVVYFDFEGCMALQCGACKKHFCGYCHAGCETSLGCHDHVRECDLNESRDGSYYATPAQMKTGQRRYRIKILKRFLRNLKKDEQAATIIELERDLEDHGISKAALFQISAGPEDVNRLDRLRWPLITFGAGKTTVDSTELRLNW